MSDNYYPNNSNQPVPPHPGQQGGKLVLPGPGGQQQSRRSPRSSSQPRHAEPVYNPQRGSQQQQSPGGGPAHNMPYGQQQHAYAPPAPPPSYYPQETPMPGPGMGNRPGMPRRRKGPRLRYGCLGALAVVVILGILSISVFQNVLAFGSAISTQAPLSTQTGYMTTSARTNLLIMSYGGSGHDGAYLMDSMMVISMIPSTTHTSLISVPRDLWVQNPANSGNYSKLNAVYEVASNNNQNPVAGGDAQAQKVSTITGMNIKYWMTINFAGFQDFIDAIGGVNVYVNDAFTANYPANNDPSINASWTTVHFNKGEQHMDGARAIEYARARYVIDNPAEASDFARSQRQQVIMDAALGKLQSISSWPHLYDAMNALKKAIYTNISLADLGLFAKKMDLNNPHTAHIGLAVAAGNVLEYATASDGESIVLPENDDWALIPPYIQQRLYN